MCGKFIKANSPLNINQKDPYFMMHHIIVRGDRGLLLPFHCFEVLLFVCFSEMLEEVILKLC